MKIPPYDMARYNAKRRGIPFRLSREQWEKIWHESGHYEERGKTSGKYCMARFGDEGAYEVGNVRIITCNENIAEIKVTDAMREARGRPHRGVPKSAEQRRKMSEANRNKPPVSDETRLKMSIAAKKRCARRAAL